MSDDMIGLVGLAAALVCLCSELRAIIVWSEFRSPAAWWALSAASGLLALGILVRYIAGAQ